MWLQQLIRSDMKTFFWNQILDSDTGTWFIIDFDCDFVFIIPYSRIYGFCLYCKIKTHSNIDLTFLNTLNGRLHYTIGKFGLRCVINALVKWTITQERESNLRHLSNETETIATEARNMSSYQHNNTPLQQMSITTSCIL